MEMYSEAGSKLYRFGAWRCIYTRAKAKATSLPICCIVFNLCVYTTATATATKIRTNRFHFHFRSSINTALQLGIGSEVSALMTRLLASDLTFPLITF